jgi:hypothetical protein
VTDDPADYPSNRGALQFKAIMLLKISDLIFGAAESHYIIENK